MKAFTEQTVKITLEMTEEQADWLKAVTQNPIGEQEDHYNAEMRKLFFEAMSSALVKQ